MHAAGAFGKRPSRLVHHQLLNQLPADDAILWLVGSATVFAIAWMTSSASSVSTLSDPAVAGYDQFDHHECALVGVDAVINHRRNELPGRGQLRNLQTRIPRMMH